MNINHIKGTHILIVTDYWEHTNGVVTALKTTVKQLQYKGYKVQVISENIAGEERKWCSWANAIYIATPENKIGFNMASPDEVAKYGYKAMLNGESVVIPGNFNKFLSFLPRILPRNIAAAIGRKIQEKNRAD